MVDNKNKFKHVRFFLFFILSKCVRVDFFFFDNIFEIFFDIFFLKFFVSRSALVEKVQIHWG